MNADPLDIFRAEAAELLEQIERGLLDLERRLDDHSLIDQVFRGLHTLKGSGAMFGFEALAAFTHHCETAFDRVRKGEAPATIELVAAVLAARDHMRALVDNPGAAFADAEANLLERLRLAVESPARRAPERQENADGAAAREWRISFSLPRATLINGINPLTLLDDLRGLGRCEVTAETGSVPPFDSLDPASLYLRWTVRLSAACQRSDIEDAFIFVMDDMTLDIEELSAPPAPSEAGPAPAPREEAGPAAPSAAAARPAPDAARARRIVDSLRVPAERLDELMDRVGELVIAQSRLSQISAAGGNLDLRAVSEEMERLSGEMRATMMVLRMAPAGALFDRFRRLIHDLQHDTAKQIELTTEGESTEMDKSVIERLADPLVHLVRNAVDHGLETPQERRAAGKPPVGRVTLSARQSGGEVIVTIADDGRGVDRARVRAKAEAAGLIAPGAALTDAELLHLIFEPGFSTAAAVTSLSGRGVGMDVVKKTIESLRGAIDIFSRDGQGATVALRIPLTLAIIDGLLVRVGAGRYVIPLAAVEECIELSREDDLRSRGRSLLPLRGKLTPFLRLREIFGSDAGPDRYQKVVVVSTGAERVGLVVDQIIGNHQTVIKSMSKLHDDVATFSGATILGDGGVALILDIANLVAAGQQQEAHLRAIA